MEEDSRGQNEVLHDDTNRSADSMVLIQT
jgi:hypothetical protein